MFMSEFDEYIVHGEPGQKEKADAWQTAIGLQDVDGLNVSAFLLNNARQLQRVILLWIMLMN